MPESTAARKAVQIVVNKQAVTLPGHQGTGLEIKQAAIAQGVEIEVSFQLSVTRGPNQRHIVGDDDVVGLHDGLVFVAVAGDDNS